MATQRQQKIDARNAIYAELKVRHTERWRSQAEDEIVDLITDITSEMSGPRIRQLGQLLHWVRVHLAGESRTNYLARMAAIHPELRPPDEPTR